MLRVVTDALDRAEARAWAQIRRENGEVTFTLGAFGSGKTPSTRKVETRVLDALRYEFGSGPSSPATASHCADGAHIFTTAFMIGHPTSSQVLSLLRRNEWDKAHAIVMGMRDKLAFRMHGLLHRIEGDLDNARTGTTGCRSVQ